MAIAGKGENLLLVNNVNLFNEWSPDDISHRNGFKGISEDV